MTPPGRSVAFGPFEWDPASGELRRGGVRVRLSRQPAEILGALLLEPGEVVTRDDLRQRLWGDDTFVDFEQGLNTAVARLRQALGDSVEAPRYVETVPGQGYRFVGPIRGEVAPRPGSPRPALVGRRAWLAGGLGAAAGALAGYVVRAPAQRPEPSRGSFVLSAPPAPPLQLSPLFSNVAISPEGSHVVYACASSGGAGLYLRPIGATTGRVLPGSDVYNPFFSPDGMEIGYYRFPDQALVRVSRLGGAPTAVADGVGPVLGTCWSSRGEILFATRFPPDGLMRVPASGGVPAPVTKPRPGERHVMPEALPGGRSALFTILPADTDEAPSRIAVVDLDTGDYRTLVPGSCPRYAAGGHLLFVLEDRLMAVRFDARRLEPAGTPETLVEGIATTARGKIGQYAVSRTGALVLVVDASTEERDLVWVDRAGREEPIAVPPRGYVYARVSPDGGRVALDVRDVRGNDIAIWDFAREALTRFTPASSVSIYPTWSRDGERIAFWSDQPPGPGLFHKAVVGSSQSRLWSEDAELRALYFFTPSGRGLVFGRQSAQGVELCRLEDGAAEPVVLLEHARNADLSPDGRRIAYQSDADGRFQICVRAFPALDTGYHQVSTRGGIQPLWSPAGGELFYIEPGPPPRVMRVFFGTDAHSAPGRAEPLFDWPYPIGTLGRAYDVSRPDGQRLLAVKERERPHGRGVPRVEIVLGWLEDLGTREG